MTSVAPISGPRRDQHLASMLAEASASQRSHLLSQTRFRSESVAEILLERGEQEQLRDSCLAASLLDLAGSLIELLPARESRLGFKAAILLANALRLSRTFDSAEAALLRALPHLEQSHERASYARTLGLLRWDQGRLEEAAGLLTFAASLYSRSKLRRELTTSQLLLGLVHADSADHHSAIPLLDPPFFRSESRPWLCARARFTLAFCLNSVDLIPGGGHGPAAVAVFSEGETFLQKIEDPNEITWLQLLGARARARIGFLQEDATRALERSRTTFYEQGRLTEYLLCSLDLLALDLMADRPPRLGDILLELEHFPLESGTDVGRDALTRFASTVSGADPWETTEGARTWLLRNLRLRGRTISPIPFA